MLWLYHRQILYLRSVGIHLVVKTTAIIDTTVKIRLEKEKTIV